MKTALLEKVLLPALVWIGLIVISKIACNLALIFWANGSAKNAVFPASKQNFPCMRVGSWTNARNETCLAFYSQRHHRTNRSCKFLQRPFFVWHVDNPCSVYNFTVLHFEKICAELFLMQVLYRESWRSELKSTSESISKDEYSNPHVDNVQFCYVLSSC